MVSTRTRARQPKVIKQKMTKRQLIQHIQTHVEENVEAAHKLSSRDVTRIVSASLEGLTDAMEKSIAPRSVGQFILPGVFKLWLRKRPAIKKGTKVRNPATGEMIPSQGRPASMRVKAGPLVRLKRAAAGEA